MPKAQKTFEEVCDDIYAFVELFVFNRIKFKYKTFSAYSLRRQSKDYQHTDIPNLLHIDTDAVRSLACYADGRRYKMTDIWRSLEPKLKHHYKTYKSFKSGKSFHLSSYYELPDETLKSLFENPPTPNALNPRVKRVWSRFIYNLKEKPIPSRHSRTSQALSLEANKTNMESHSSFSEPSDDVIDEIIDEILTETEDEAMKKKSRSQTASKRIRSSSNAITATKMPSLPSSIREPFRSELAAFASEMQSAVKSSKIGQATAEKLLHLLGWEKAKLNFPLAGFTEEDSWRNIEYHCKVAKDVFNLIVKHKLHLTKESKEWFTSYTQLLKIRKSQVK